MCRDRRNDKPAPQVDRGIAGVSVYEVVILCMAEEAPDELIERVSMLECEGGQGSCVAEDWVC